MKAIVSRRLIQCILSASYTPIDLREFVELCYVIALPLVRSKISSRKLNLNVIGLKEADIVYDCLAELFYRDEKGEFVQIKAFFEKQIGELEKTSEEVLLSTLRHLIFAKVNNNIIRLYSEADPTLAKILRNMKLALDRSKVFQEVYRLGELHLMPRGVDPLLHLPHMPFERLQQACTRVILLQDDIPEMMRKLCDILVEQSEYRRRVSLVTAALLFKEIYQLGWKAEQTQGEVIEEGATVAKKADEDTLSELTVEVCQAVAAEMHRTYVESGKRTEQLFRSYMLAVNQILLVEFGDEQAGNLSYYDCLKSQMPRLDKRTYAHEHRSILKYLAKIAKERMRRELKKF